MVTYAQDTIYGLVYNPLYQPKMETYLKNNQVIKLLEPHLTDARIERLRKSLENRTRHIVTVLEKPYDGGNINAAMRSAEAFGFHDFHIIEGPKHHRPTGRTSAGAGKWLNTINHEATKQCLSSLRNDGYRLIATSGEAEKLVGEVDFDQKTALIFGSEHPGISNDVTDMADEVVRLPIVGMVESYNLSVAVALSLYTAFNQIKELDVGLSKSEKEELLAEFYRRSVPNSDKILAL